MGWLRRYVIQVAGYLREAGAFIALAAFVFIAGALWAILNPDAFAPYTNALEQFVERFRGKRGIELIFMIFFQNLSAAFLAFWLGTLLCLVPLFSAFSNGLILGIVIHRAVAAGLTGTLLKLLPHGVLEFPAMHVAWALGIWRGMWLLERGRAERYRERASKSYRVFFAVVIPLLALAAMIEGTLMSFSR